jgi:hypothetical protein
MNNTEIRIGNIIKRNGLIVTVDEQTFWDMKNNPQLYTPFPLNEGWLLKFGFEKEGSEWKLFPCAEVQIIVFNEKGYNGVMFYTRTIHTDYTPIYCESHINYAHQLQNLYFSITGKELKIKN